jgi:glycosyltransferase involved in cell wall biosynthesis
MRIVMLIDRIGPWPGGGERLAMGLASALAERGHELVLCVTRVSSPEDRAPLERAGVRVLSLERRGRFRLWAFRPLLKLLREEEIEVLHAHKFGSNLWGVLLGRICRVPAIVAHEQTWSYQGQIHRVLLDALIGRLSSAFVAVSSADRDRMISREHVPATKITVIPNACIPRSDPEGGDLRAELRIPAEAPIVGTVAVLRRQKALHVLLDAFARIDGLPSRPRLVIAGDGECREELEARAEELRITDRVSFLGIREDIGTLLGAFDVAAMSSDFEGTPLFALECMSAGTALVATDVGGLPDLVENGRTALLVPQRDPDALAAAISALLADPHLRRRIGDASRERAEDFTIDRIADRFTALYESLLARARS